MSRNHSLQNSKKNSKKKFEGLKNQEEIDSGLQNLTEASKILEYRLSHDSLSLVPTVCQNRSDEFNDLHSCERSPLIEYDDDVFLDELNLDEIASLISKGYEDIRSSNPYIRSTEDQVDKLIWRVLRRKSYRAFEELMTPLLDIQGIDMQVDFLLLAALFVPSVPKIASNIQYWVTSNLNVSFSKLQGIIPCPRPRV